MHPVTNHKHTVCTVHTKLPHHTHTVEVEMSLICNPCHEQLQINHCVTGKDFCLQKPQNDNCVSCHRGKNTEKGTFGKYTGGRKKACKMQLQCQLCPWRSSAFNPSECWIRGFGILQRHTALLLCRPPISSTVPSTLCCTAASAADREEEADVWSSSRWWMSVLAVNPSFKLHQVYCKQRWTWVKWHVS